MMDEAKISPLPGQISLPFMEPQPPATRSRYNLKAWRDGKEAAQAGLSLQDCPTPARRGYGDSLAARKAHTRWINVYRQWWREGFRSVTLFPVNQTIREL